MNGLKTCSTCKQEYPPTTEFFHYSKRAPGGLAGRCKGCCKATVKKWAMANPEKVRAQNKRSREANPEKKREQHRKWAKANPEKVREGHRRWAKANPEKVREHRVAYRRNSKDYYRRPQVKLSKSFGLRMRQSLKSNKSGMPWEALAGYTLADLMAHLESQFTKGMTWENYGRDGWHIDHIKPVSHFKFTSPGDPEFHECWSLWNLRPMWAKENLSKHAKCEAPPLPLLTKETP